MSNRDRVLSYLESVFPGGATNEEIVGHTAIRPHAQVFQITQRLMEVGTLKGVREGREWRFFLVNRRESGETAGARRSRDVTTVNAVGEAPSVAFERVAKIVMSAFFQTPLAPRKLPDVPKMFDLVSDDGRIAGDAKFYTLVNGTGVPPAKFSVIAEHVWLLEKTSAHRRFLVFGNDKRVPEGWLKRYGHLANNVEFYFIADDRIPQRLRSSNDKM